MITRPTSRSSRDTNCAASSNGNAGAAAGDDVMTVKSGSALECGHESPRTIPGGTGRARAGQADHRLDVKNYERRAVLVESVRDSVAPGVERIEVEDRLKSGTARDHREVGRSRARHRLRA